MKNLDSGQETPELTEQPRAILQGDGCVKVKASRGVPALGTAQRGDGELNFQSVWPAWPQDARCRREWAVGSWAPLALAKKGRVTGCFRLMLPKLQNLKVFLTVSTYVAANL